MKILFKHQALEKQSSDACVVREHPIDEEMINFATAKITGRYPSHGYACNTKCKEVAYVYEGRGKITINGHEHVINAGDLIMIDPGEKFCWEGNMHLGLSCTPAWTPEQCEFLD